MKIRNMMHINESARVAIKDGKVTRTSTRKVTMVPCVLIHSDAMDRVLGNRVLRRLSYKEIPLIEHKPMLQIECSHK